MKIRLLIWCLILSSVTLFAQLTYSVDEQIQITDVAVGLTASKISPTGQGINATKAVCRLEQAEVRYRIASRTLVPTAGGSGTLLEIGDVIALQGHDVLTNFFAIRTGSTNGILTCQYTAP